MYAVPMLKLDLLTWALAGTQKVSTVRRLAAIGTECQELSDEDYQSHINELKMAVQSRHVERPEHINMLLRESYKNRRRWIQTLTGFGDVQTIIQTYPCLKFGNYVSVQHYVWN